MKEEKIAVFTTEIAVDAELHLYAGGQGYLLGDIAMSAKALGVPMVIVSLLNHFGYYDQGKNHNGMTVEYNYRDYKNILEDTGLIFPINICPFPTWAKGLNWVKVWKIPEEKYGTVPIYLLDTDIEQNDHLARKNSYFLYGGFRVGATEETAIAQALILGKGGVKALRRLKIPVRKYHLNEAHTVFAAIEVFSGYLKQTGNFDKALALTKEKVVFTTHTPIKAGNPERDLDTVCKMMGISKENTITKDILFALGGNRFNMAAACLKLAGHANAVSKRHLEIVREMWGWLGKSLPPIDEVTNGVNQKRWQWPEFRNNNSADESLAAKLKYKNMLNERAVAENELALPTDINWLVFAKRWEAYKRPKLLFQDLRWLSEQLKQKKFALTLAGKPHPDDQARIDDWNWIYSLSKDRENFPNIVMLQEYDLSLSKLLKGTADLWLNTMRASNESSGTSGMSAAMNEALNISVPDGWMFYANPKNHFLFGSRYPMTNIGTQDAHDADELKIAAGNSLTMLSNPEEAQKMKLAAKKEAVEDYNSDRVVLDYAKLFYDM